jgi:hypothetical protein
MKEKRKNLRKIEKAITKLKQDLKKIELHPCQGDLDIQRKEEELKSLNDAIYDLEKEANKFSIYLSGAKSSEGGN